MNLRCPLLEVQPPSAPGVLSGSQSTCLCSRAPCSGGPSRPLSSVTPGSDRTLYTSAPLPLPPTCLSRHRPYDLTSPAVLPRSSKDPVPDGSPTRSVFTRDRPVSSGHRNHSRRVSRAPPCGPPRPDSYLLLHSLPLPLTTARKVLLDDVTPSPTFNVSSSTKQNTFQDLDAQGYAVDDRCKDREVSVSPGHRWDNLSRSCLGDT